MSRLEEEYLNKELCKNLDTLSALIDIAMQNFYLKFLEILSTKSISVFFPLRFLLLC